MLILTRRVGESICIGDDVVVTLVQIAPGKVRLGIEAPPGRLILRQELIDRAAASSAAPIVGEGPMSGANLSSGTVADR